MCGILAVLRPQTNVEDLFYRGVARGPDDSRCILVNDVWLGFHRLAINGLDPASGQPMSWNNIHLICNGEIYNHRELMGRMNVAPATRSDCEVILHLYERYGIEQTVHMIDASEFAFVLYDANTNTVYSARDPYGVRPLYRAVCGTQIALGSELKMLSFAGASYSIQAPGTIDTYVGGELRASHTYSSLPSIQSVSGSPLATVRTALYDAVRKRVLNTDRPMACLLSGGLDSSIVTALVQQVRNELGYAEQLETYSIGLAGAEDLRYAEIMAEFLGTRHTSVVVSEEEFFNAIPEVIHSIESYDTTTVRASVGNFLVARYIAEHSQAKVVFNGDGSDELTGGYLYFHYAPDVIAKDQECRRLLTDIHMFDALRSDKCIASNGLEARTPFLDRAFVQTYMALPLDARFPESQCEKYLLRRAFEHLLPPDICWRTKEAFSDGVSSLNRSWYQIIADMIPVEVKNEFLTRVKGGHNAPTTPEQYYYRALFPYDASILPYFWMPRFVQQGDCSARTLSVYKK